MMSMACGLAATGKVPYCSTFAIFASGRAYDQVRLGIAHNELKVRIGASPRRRLARRGRRLPPDDRGHRADAGDAADAGASSPPTTTRPTAPSSTATRRTTSRCTCASAALRRPVVYEEIPETLGDGVDVLREGKDISLIATGHMVWRALEAAESLEREDGVEAEVVNVSIIKPLDRQSILESLAKTGVAVTAEEHRVVGGLADAVRSVAAEQHPVPIFAVGMGDEFGLSGTGEACMEHFGLTARGIADRAREALVLKPIVAHPPLHGPEWT